MAGRAWLAERHEHRASRRSAHSDLTITRSLPATSSRGCLSVRAVLGTRLLTMFHTRAERMTQRTGPGSHATIVVNSAHHSGSAIRGSSLSSLALQASIVPAAAGGSSVRCPLRHSVRSSHQLARVFRASKAVLAADILPPAFGFWRMTPNGEGTGQRPLTFAKKAALHGDSTTNLS